MKIIIVDDHKLFSDGFCLLLKKLEPNVLINAYEYGEQSLQAIKDSLDWDLIILDINLPDIDGITVLRSIRKQGILIPVVFVSATENMYKIACTYYHGANGFIPKASSTKVMLSAIQTVIDGEFYFNPDLKNSIEMQINDLEKHTNMSEKLTARQLEVLQIMAKGASNKRIAEILFVSEPTVKSHISIIYHLFKVNKRVECIRKAEWLGLV